MDVIGGLFIYGVFRAIEKFVEKGLDAAFSPAEAEVKARFEKLAGKDEKTARKDAFERAVQKAYSDTVSQYSDEDTVNYVINAMRDDLPKHSVEMLASETAKLLLVSDSPNLAKMTSALREHFQWESGFSGQKRPSDSEISQILTTFLKSLKNAILDEPAYEAFLAKETVSLLRRLVELSTPHEDDLSVYLSQLELVYGYLDFVGIPDLHQSVRPTVQDIFVPLSLRREALAEDLVQRKSVDELTLPESLNSSEEDDLGSGSTLQEALSKSQRLVVLGDPGAGKTTLLKYLTLACATDRQSEFFDVPDPLVPIYVPLREFIAEASASLGDLNLASYFASRAASHLNLSLGRTFFQSWLESGKCCVALDGLDEVWSLDERKAVTEAVRSLVSRYPRNVYIVTSRIVGYLDAPLDARQFTHYRVLQFDNQQITQFVRAWYAYREHDLVERAKQVSDLLSTIFDEINLLNLARNPLLLTIIALVHRIEVDLPHERVRLYNKCVTALTDTWEKAKGLTTEHRARPFYIYRRRLLERLAFNLHSGASDKKEAQLIKVGDLEDAIMRFLMEIPSLGWRDDRDAAQIDSQSFVTLARARTGLLVERGRDSFAFPHPTFQEYLAACDIERRCDEVSELWDEIKPHLHDPHWLEVILLLLGNLNRYDYKPTKLIQRILDAGELDPLEPYIHRHRILAVRALADRVNVDGNLAETVVGTLLDDIETMPDSVMYYTVFARPSEKYELSKAIFDIISRLEIAPFLKSRLVQLVVNTDANYYARSRALQMLAANISTDAEIFELVKNYALDTDSSLYNSAGAIFVDMPVTSHEVMRIVLSLARSSSTRTSTRLKILRNLTIAGEHDTVKELAYEYLADSNEYDLRLGAIRSLNQLGYTTEEIPFRVEEPTEEPLNTYKTEETTENSTIFPLLEWRTHEPYSFSIRIKACNRLARLGFIDEALESLAQILKSDHENLELSLLLLKLYFPDLPKSEQVQQSLADHLNDTTIDSRIRVVVADMLASIGFPVKACETARLLSTDAKQSIKCRAEALGVWAEQNPNDDFLESLISLASLAKAEKDPSYQLICSMMATLTVPFRKLPGQDNSSAQFIEATRLMGKCDRAKMNQQYDDALAYYDHATAFDASYYDPLARGLLLSYCERLDEALTEYGAAIAEDPDSEFAHAAYYNIAVVKAYQNDPGAQTSIEVARTCLLDGKVEEGRREYGLAGLNALSGSIEDGLTQLLQAGLLLKDYALDWAAHDLAWKNLHNDNRFQNIINKILEGLLQTQEGNMDKG